MKVTNKQVMYRAEQIAQLIHTDLKIGPGMYKIPAIFGIPRGGIPVAYALTKFLPSAVVVDDVTKANVIVDDIVDSGATRDRFKDMNKNALFYNFYDAVDEEDWVVFPWEATMEGSAEDIPIRLLQFIGEDINRGGLKETPGRFIRAWKEYTKGYEQNGKDVLKTFEDGAAMYDEMVLQRDIPVYSHCEHHLAPFFGVAHIAYIPQGRIVGLSKLSRLVDVYARRLQVQERLTDEIAKDIDDVLKPKGVGVILECRHLCMESRGVQRQGTSTVTSAMKGVFLDKQSTRDEFMRLVR